MNYNEIVEVYEKIEATSSRIKMTNLLVGLFTKTPKELIDKVVYLTQGKIYPDYYGIELGIAEKMAIKAMSIAYGVGTKDIERLLGKLGDLGLVAQELASRKKQMSLFYKPLTVQRVYEVFDKIAKATGEGSQDLKIRLLSGLLADAKPKEAKYIIRTVTGNMRLGIADMTILDALAIAFLKTKKYRDVVERAYNLSNDLGDVARTLAYEGLEGIKKYKIKPGKPIRMMLAQRMENVREILLKVGGKAACEWKYDGERVQIHKINDEIILYSRRAENITEQYPDVCELAKTSIKAEEAVVEGEIVAYNPETLELLPFQELMHRRRKYGIEEAMKKYPVITFLFDALYVDGEDLTQKPFIERRRKLEEIVSKNDKFTFSNMIISDNPEEIEKFFYEALENGCEGLMIKALDGVYQAGARGWLWIKLKKSYESKIIEPIDVVVVGAFFGKGRRAKTYGALLAAVYNKEKDIFETICKVGSGFTDKDLEKLPEIFDKYRIKKRHARVVSELEADVWFTPSVVIEIIGDELTLSPVHTCAYGVIREGVGIAVRFPRFTGRWRFDKAPEDATTTKEIIEMYKAQLKRIEESSS